MAENDEEPAKQDNSFKSEQEKALWRKKAVEEYRLQLENDERFKDYAKQFSGHSVASFVEDFARKKTWWVEWGEKYEQWKEDENVKWLEQAWERLKDIQQKKLFDLQCEWRAEKIKLRDSEICFDFIVQSYDIFGCSYISPIEEDEFDLYMQFANSDDFEPINDVRQAQNYEDLKEAYESENEYGGHYPQWYAFADSRRGTGFYISLPDIHGEKERFYISLAEGKPKEQKPVESKNVLPEGEKKTPAKPYLNYSKDGFMKWFITTFDAELLKYYEAYADTAKANNEDIEENIKALTSSRMVLPIKKSRDWKEGIMRTGLELYRRKMVEALPIAYEQYRMKTDNGIQVSEGLGLFGMMTSLQRQGELEKILRGRELNGEARNLEF